MSTSNGACAHGDVDTVTALIERCGLDPTQAEPDLNAQTPLHVAAARGHMEVVALLLRRSTVDSAKQDVDGRTPMQCAEQHGYAEVAGFIEWWQPASSASFDQGHEEKKTTAPSHPDLPTKDENVRNDVDDAEAVKKMKKTETATKIRTGLPMLTEEFAHLEGLVARLFDVIGERSAQQSRRMSTEVERERLIKEAREVKYLAPLVAVVEFLAKAPGAALLEDNVCHELLESNEGFTERNRSWFHVACARGDLDAVTALVERCGLGPTQCEPDRNKETPLHTAAHKGLLDVVAFLIKCGLDETLEDCFGRTPR
ncbi:MAG: ankyrin repeat domain-containing protein, partial [Deinococcota bacterium]